MNGKWQEYSDASVLRFERDGIKWEAYVVEQWAGAWMWEIRRDNDLVNADDHAGMTRETGKQEVEDWIRVQGVEL